jgi:serine/threonine protein kinase
MVKGDSYNETIDNWSLGILAFEFLVGKPPFEHSTKSDTLNSIMKEDIVFPAELS